LQVRDGGENTRIRRQLGFGHPCSLRASASRA